MHLHRPNSIHDTTYARETLSGSSAHAMLDVLPAKGTFDNELRSRRVQALADRYDETKDAYNRAYTAQNESFEKNLVRNLHL